MIDYTLARAFSTLALAGRELGSGPGAAVDRLAPDLWIPGAYLPDPELDARFDLGQQIIADRANMRHGFEAGWCLGVVSARIEQGDEHTLQGISDISAEWLEGH